MIGPRASLAIAAATGALGISYAVAESYLRLTVRPPPDPAHHAYVGLPFAAYEYVVGADQPGLAARQVEIRYSALGLRADELDLGSSDPVHKIVVLGGSVAQGHLLPEEATWSRIMQRSLEAARPERVWVANLGGAGLQTLDLVAHARLLLRELRPELVVIMTGGNDFQGALEQKIFTLPLDVPQALAPFLTKGQLYQPIGQGAAVLEALEPSYAAFFLLRRYPRFTFDYGKIYAKLKARRAAAPKQDELPELDDALDVFRANLDQLVAALAEIDARPVFLTHPALWRAGLSEDEQRRLWSGYSCMECEDPVYYSASALAAGLERFNREVAALCAERSIPLLDAAAMIEKVPDNFFDDAHLVEGPNRALGEAVAALVLEKGLLR